MKPLTSRIEDTGTLQDLGRASVQIVHDLKNQLNGLKLYATFLRKRIEKGDRPEDEQETIAKLISGLDKAASDLSTIVQYGHKIELKKQSGLDLHKVVRSVCLELSNVSSPLLCDSISESLNGEFDQSLLTDALKWISKLAQKNQRKGDGIAISARLDELNAGQAVIEWSGLVHLEHDPFRSFVGSDEIRASLAGRIIAAHGGSATYDDGCFLVRLPLSE